MIIKYICFHPYRPVWYVPDQGMDYTILHTYRVERVNQILLDLV